MSTCTHRKVLTDANGVVWDFGNPNIVAIKPETDPAVCSLVMGSGQVTTPTSNIPISFADASAAFEAT